MIQENHWTLLHTGSSLDGQAGIEAVGHCLLTRSTVRGRLSGPEDASTIAAFFELANGLEADSIVAASSKAAHYGRLRSVAATACGQKHSHMDPLARVQVSVPPLKFRQGG